MGEVYGYLGLDRAGLNSIELDRDQYALLKLEMSCTSLNSYDRLFEIEDCRGREWCFFKHSIVYINTRGE